jgi:hypothetical protein
LTNPDGAKVTVVPAWNSTSWVTSADTNASWPTPATGDGDGNAARTESNEAALPPVPVTTTRIVPVPIREPLTGQ